MLTKKVDKVKTMTREEKELYIAKLLEDIHYQANKYGTSNKQQVEIIRIKNIIKELVASL